MKATAARMAETAKSYDTLAVTEILITMTMTMAPVLGSVEVTALC